MPVQFEIEVISALAAGMIPDIGCAGAAVLMAVKQFTMHEDLSAPLAGTGPFPSFPDQESPFKRIRCKQKGIRLRKPDFKPNRNMLGGILSIRTFVYRLHYPALLGNRIVKVRKQWASQPCQG